MNIYVGQIYRVKQDHGSPRWRGKEVRILSLTGIAEDVVTFVRLFDGFIATISKNVFLKHLVPIVEVHENV